MQTLLNSKTTTILFILNFKMVKLNITSNFATIVLEVEFLVFYFDKNQNKWIFFKSVRPIQKIEELNINSIQCSVFSPCEQYFGICIDRNVIIYSTNTWEILHTTLAERKASCLAFFPRTRAFLIADKSGCAVCYSFENGLEKTDFSLGHNSMLTGALITQDEKFIITCDRDEKIRVTNYPNVYNIETYCLGHKMFVSCIQLLPTDYWKLISSSGDGTIRLWDYKTGKELCFYNSVDIKESGDNLKYIITKFVTSKCDSFSLLAFTQYKSADVKILKIECSELESYTMNLINTITLISIPWDISFYNKSLICLLPDKENPFNFWSSCFSEISEIKSNFFEVIKYIKNNWVSFAKPVEESLDEIPVLLKREIDNLQEYEQRKKARLQKTGRTS